MGLLTGGLNGRRFRITKPLPSGFRDTFLEAVRDQAFVSDPEASDNEPRIGWTDAFDASKTTFELNDFLFDRFAVLTLRLDKKTVNGRYLKIRLAERVRELCEQQGRKNLSKNESEMVKEQLTAELHRVALPSVSTADFAWDTHTGEVLVFSTSDTVIDLLSNLVFETFGATLREERMVDWLHEKFEWTEIVDRAARFFPDARGGAGVGGVIEGWHEDDPLEGAHRPLASDFITWLWLQSESSDGHFRVIDAQNAAISKLSDEPVDEWNDITETLKHADLTLWLESRLKLQNLGAEQTETTLLLGEAPTSSEAARIDLAAGKQPVEARLGLKLDELEVYFTLTAAPGGLVISGMKLPFEVKKGQEEKIFERMLLLDLVHTTLKQLFQQFFLARTSEAWDGRVTQWTSTEMAAK